MKSLVNFTIVLLFAAVSSAAEPVVSNVQLTQGPDRKVQIAYTLTGAPGIVTYEIFTNGVSVGGFPLWRSYGDVNVKVQPGNRMIFWQPREWNDRFIVDGSVSVKVTAYALDNPPDYMAVDLGMPSNRLWYADAASVPGDVTNKLYKTEKLLMRRIHAAGVVWRKDSAAGDETGHNDTEIMRPVMLTKDYYIGVFQVTYRQHVLLVNHNFAGQVDYPEWPKQRVYVTMLRGDASTCDWPTTGSEVDSNLPIGKLRTYTGIDTFDLPTDAQWDFACLGGGTHARFGVLTDTALTEYAWFSGCNYTDGRFGAYEDNPTDGGNETYKLRFQRVGLLKPNPYGLYDMLGNGSELCNDWYGTGDDYAKFGELQIDPKGPQTGTARVVHACSVNHGFASQRAGC